MPFPSPQIVKLRLCESCGKLVHFHAECFAVPLCRPETLPRLVLLRSPFEQLGVELLERILVVALQ